MNEGREPAPNLGFTRRDNAAASDACQALLKAMERAMDWGIKGQLATALATATEKMKPEVDAAQLLLKAMERTTDSGVKGQWQRP